MSNTRNINLNYDRDIKIAEDICWVGFYDIESGLYCNPYIIIDGEEAVVIDGGSRPDFSTVMMKILQTGIHPSSIKTLIYQHYDPDLCGSIPNFESIIGKKDLTIISDKENNMFIRHYSVSSRLRSLEGVTHKFEFSSGRTLQFFNTPYSHSAGSFVTFDSKTGVLFTSDLFGSLGKKWDLFLELEPDCRVCTDYTDKDCKKGSSHCPLSDIINFHRRIMTSETSLRYALEQIAEIPFTMIAPQHGSVIPELKDIAVIAEKLVTLKGVGINRLLGDRLDSKLGDISPLMERVKKNES